jgi:Tol biopolymer transport system component
MKLLLLLAASTGAAAQQAPFTLEQVLSAAFPSELTASPKGNKFAWFENARGVRNVMVAEPPAYQAHRVTAYTADDGQELSELVWTPDGAAIAYVRGMGPNGAGNIPNPAIDPRGTEQAVWLVALAGGAPRRIGDGSEPAVSPKGDRLAWVRHGEIWWAPLAGGGTAALAFKARGECGRPVWSPDGSRIAFPSDRGDHGFIGVYDFGSGTLRYLDPSTDKDESPEWSPDGRSVAFLRFPSTGVREIRQPQRAGEPWSIRVASAETGKGREIWHAAEGPGSVFRSIVSDRTGNCCGPTATAWCFRGNATAGRTCTQ